MYVTNWMKLTFTQPRCRAATNTFTGWLKYQPSNSWQAILTAPFCLFWLAVFHLSAINTSTCIYFGEMASSPLSKLIICQRSSPRIAWWFNPKFYIDRPPLSVHMVMSQISATLVSTEILHKSGHNQVATIPRRKALPLFFRAVLLALLSLLSDRSAT